MAKNGIRAIDVAKALIDKGFHPPTVYFPAIVKEAMMIEPTETESKETLDAFIDAMIDIAERAGTEPETLKTAPETTVVSRPNETVAAKSLNIASL
jgi:glycine dehydrogenase subunit 2